jgi:hypothetical protein
VRGVVWVESAQKGVYRLDIRNLQFIHEYTSTVRFDCVYSSLRIWEKQKKMWVYKK